MKHYSPDRTLSARLLASLSVMTLLSACDMPASKTQQTTMKRRVPAQNQELVAQPAVAPAPSAPAPVNPAAIAPPPATPVQAAAQPDVSSLPPPVNDPESSPSDSSWFGRLFGHPNPKPDASMEAEKKAPTPSLSSVPETPPEFDTVKDGKQQATQELQNDHAAAQQQKQSLDAEPSGQQPLAPVDASSAPGNPIVLGHISDNSPDPKDAIRPYVPPAAATPDATAPQLQSPSAGQ